MRFIVNEDCLKIEGDSALKLKRNICDSGTDYGRWRWSSQVYIKSVIPYRRSANDHWRDQL